MHYFEIRARRATMVAGQRREPGQVLYRGAGRSPEDVEHLKANLRWRDWEVVPVAVPAGQLPASASPTADPPPPAPPAPSSPALESDPPPAAAPAPSRSDLETLHGIGRDLAAALTAIGIPDRHTLAEVLRGGADADLQRLIRVPGLTARSLKRLAAELLKDATDPTP
jgi:predicted flap endonuclease-1-like 5' DNA nuclease